jgi:quercetin dioxygenase-like cupin family protein
MQTEETTMRQLKSKFVSVGVCAACAFGGIAMGIAWATPSAGVTTTVLAGPVTFDDIKAMSLVPDEHLAMIMTKGESDVYMVHNKIAPGGETGWHSHPGISFVLIRAGAATAYDGNDPNTPHVLATGTGLVEQAGHVHNVRNEGTTDLELVVFQLVPAGAPRRIDAPAP